MIIFNLPRYGKTNLKVIRLFARPQCYYKKDYSGNIIGIYIDDPELIPLGTFPKEICLLNHLEELSLSNCEIRKIPDEIYQLTSLKKLVLEYNKIKEIPKSLYTIKKLSYISLKGNRTHLNNSKISLKI